MSVNNAGVGLLGPVESISIDEMKRVFETNFFGAVRMIKEVMPDMKKRRSGHIVVMSSVMGLQGTTPPARFKRRLIREQTKVEEEEREREKKSLMQERENTSRGPSFIYLRLSRVDSRGPLAL